jgi:peroxiredoxin (alkyl hydroperoxide reductase subunit C)
MSEDKKASGCVAKAAGPVLSGPAAGAAPAPETRKEKTMSVMVGTQAPDFEASAYHEGGFKNVKLSEFRGKWVFLCFYPGDFTFV